MSKEHFEVYVVVIGRREGKRYAERSELQVPLDLALGRYEKLSDLQVREFTHDLQAEAERREVAAAREAEVAAKCEGYDPYASQIRRTC